MKGLPERFEQRGAPEKAEAEPRATAARRIPRRAWVGGMSEEVRGARNATKPADPYGAVREGVQRGILEALNRDRELSGVRMVAKLTAAGAAGVAAALCALLLFGGHTLGRESPVHVVLCGIAWTGLLVVCFTLLMLRIRVRHLSVVQMVAVGVVGLVFAALLLLACPEPRSLDWWQATPVGRSITAVGGPSLSAFLLAGMAAALASGLATLVVQARAREIASPRASAAISFLLLLPGVVLQSLGGPRSVAIALIIGTVLGAYGGISSALAVTRRRPSRD